MRLNKFTIGAVLIAGLSYLGCSKKIPGYYSIFKGTINGEQVELRSDNPSLINYEGQPLSQYLIITKKMPNKVTKTIQYWDDMDRKKRRGISDGELDRVVVVGKDSTGRILNHGEYGRYFLNPIGREVIKQEQPDFEEYLAAVNAEIRKRALQSVQ